jgi:hypothetical protein
VKISKEGNSWATKEDPINLKIYNLNITLEALEIIKPGSGLITIIKRAKVEVKNLTKKDMMEEHRI